MQKAVISFVISALIGLGLGYVAFEVVGGGKGENAEVAKQEQDKSQASNESTQDDKEVTENVSADSNILKSKGCLGCHSVSSLNLQGGATGPDLSKAFENVEGKHGKPIEEFLKEPTSAVMSGVIGGNPLSDEERAQVLKILQEASQK